jgi:hypothetical protein
MSAVMGAAVATQPHIIRRWQVKKFLNVARLAYRLNSCDAPGLELTSSDPMEFEFTGVFINYHPNIIEMYIGGIGTYGANANVRLWLHLNADMLSSGKTVCSRSVTLAKSVILTVTHIGAQ